MGRAEPDQPHSAGLGFVFRPADRGGTLTLANQELFEWLRVERLVLEIPPGGEPLAPGTPAERFQRRRTHVRAAVFQVPQRNLHRLVARRTPALAQLGVDELTVRCCDGYLAVTGRVRDGAHTAELTCRVYLAGTGPTLRVLIGQPLIHGHLPTPAPLLAHRVLVALLGAAEPQPTETAPAQASKDPEAAQAAATADSAPDPVTRPSIAGLGQLAIDPLAAFLWSTLPAAGWRLPGTDQVSLAGVHVRRGLIEVGYEPVRAPAGQDTSATVPLTSAELAQLVILLDQVRDADEALRTGDTKRAVGLYRKLVASDGLESLACERLLAVCASTPVRFSEGDELASEWLERVPGLIAAHAALAGIATARSQASEAAEHFEHLAEAAAAASDDDVYIAATLAGARLLRAVDPAGSTRLYERVQARRPMHPEAGKALIERYTEEARWPELIELLRGRIAAAVDRRRQARDYVQLARIMAEHLHDREGARRELEHARSLDPDHAPVFEALAELELTVDTPQAARAAIDGLRRAAALWLRQGDNKAAGRAYVRAGAVYERLGDEREANALYQQVLVLVPDHPAALRSAAALAARRGDHPMAAELWTQLTRLGGHTPRADARYRLELGRSLLASGNEPAAEDMLRQATSQGSDAIAAEAHHLLADMRRARQDPRGAAAELDAAIVSLSRAADRFFADAHARAAQPADAGEAQTAARAPGTAQPLSGRAQTDASGMSDDTARFDDGAPGLDADEDGSRYLTRAAHLARERALLLEELGRADAARADYHRAHALARKVDAVGGRDEARTLVQSDRLRGDSTAQRRWFDALLKGGASGSERIELLLARAELYSQRVADLDVGDDLDAPGAEDSAKTRAQTRAQIRAQAGAEDSDEALTPAEIEAALRDIDAALAASPSSVQRALALMLQAQLRGAAGDLAGRAQALTERAALVVGAQDRAEAEAEAARAWLDAGDGEAAVSAANRGLARIAERAPGRARRRLLSVLGEAAWRTRDWDAITAAYGALLADAQRPGNDATDPGSSADSTRARWAYRLGMAAEARGDLAGAAQAFEQVLSVGAAARNLRADSFRALARAHAHAGEFAQAAEIFERLARDIETTGSKQDQADAWYRAGELWQRQGGADQARSCFEAALALLPDHLAALDGLESVARSRDDHEQVAAILERKLAAVTGHPERQKAILLRLAEHQQNRLDLADAAVQSYRRVLEIDPHCRPALAFVAAAEARAGNLESAAAAYERLARPLPGEIADERQGRPDKKDRRDRRDRRDQQRGKSDARGEQASPADDYPESITAELPIELSSNTSSELLDQRIAAADALASLARRDERFRRRAQTVLTELRVVAPDHPTLLSLSLDALTAVADPGEQPDDQHAAQPPETTQPLVRAAGRPTSAAPAAAASTPDELQADPAAQAVPAAPAAATAPTASDTQPISQALADSIVEQAGAGSQSREQTSALNSDPESEEALRERADAASAAGNDEEYARCLLVLAERIQISSQPGQIRHRLRRAEVFLELADLYYDRLGDPTGARQAMREAAEAYGPGSRRDATLRMLAAEAAAAGEDVAAISAYTAIEPARRTSADRMNLASSYQRMGRDARALAVLEEAKRDGQLSDDGAVLLFGLRQQHRVAAERAAQLERNAAVAYDPERLLREALALYQDELEDEAGAERVRQALADLARGPAQAQASTSQPMATPAAQQPAAAPAVAAPVAPAAAAPAPAAPAAAAPAPVAAPAAPAPPVAAPAVPAGGTALGRIALRRRSKPFEATRLGVEPASNRPAAERSAAQPQARPAAPAAQPAPRQRQQTARPEATRAANPAGTSAATPTTTQKLVIQAASERTTMPTTLKMGTPVVTPAPPTQAPPPRQADQARPDKGGTQLGFGTSTQRAGRSTLTYPGVELDIRKLENAAISTQDFARAAELLAQSLALRTGRLARHGQTLDDDCRAVLSRLRDVARRSRQYRLLVIALEAAASVAGEPATTGRLLAEAGNLLRNELGEPAAGAEQLMRALQAMPSDAAILIDLDALLRKLGDSRRLVDAYEMHLTTLEGPRRARPLYELGRLYRDALNDPGRAMSYFARAHDADPELADVWLPLANARFAANDMAGARQLYELVLERGAPDANTREWILSRMAAIGDEPEPAVGSGAPPYGRGPGQGAQSPQGPQNPVSRIEEALRRAAAFEARGQRDAAIAHYRNAAEREPDDPRPLEALERLYRKQNDLEALIDTLGDLIEDAPTPATRAALWFRRARVYRDELHREPEAYQCLKQAHAEVPDNSEIAHALRNIAMARGEWALAADLLRREIATASNTREAGALNLELALIYDEKLLDADQARVHYEEALALDPAIPAVPRPLARLYELAGRHADAARMNEIAAQHARDDSQRSRLLYRAAVSAERAGDVDNARRLYHLAALAAPEGDDASASHRALLRLDDKSGATRSQLLELELREASDDEHRIDILRQLLDRATMAGDLDAADRHAHALLKMDGTDLSAYLVLKSRAESTLNWSSLASLLNARAVSLGDPDERAAVYYDLGRLYQTHLNDPDEAMKAFEKALVADPSHPAALEALADLAFLRAEWDRARQLYARMRPETTSLSADAIAYRRGVIAEALGYEREALEAFGRAIEYLPAHRDALTAVCRLALRVGDLPRAIEASRALLELLPASDVQAITAARLRLAELCEKAGDLDAAVSYNEQVLSEEPNSQLALRSLVRLHERREDFESAARMLRRLIGTTPAPSQRASLLYHLGEIYRTELDDLEQAADSYLKGIDLDPTHVPTLRRLLDHYWREDDPVELIQIVEALVEQNALLNEQTGVSTLARSLVAVAATGDVHLTRQIARWLGPRLLDHLLPALAEAVERQGSTLHVKALARAVSLICEHAPPVSVADIADRLAAMEAHTRPLVQALRTAPAA